MSEQQLPADSLYATCRRVWVCKLCGKCVAHCKHTNSDFHEDLQRCCPVELAGAQPSEQQAPERIRILRRDGQLDNHWYYTDAAVGKHEESLEYARVDTRVPGDVDGKPLSLESLLEIERLQRQRRQSPVPTDAWLYVAEIDRLLGHIRAEREQLENEIFQDITDPHPPTGDLVSRVEEFVGHKEECKSNERYPSPPCDCGLQGALGQLRALPAAQPPTPTASTTTCEYEAILAGTLATHYLDCTLLEFALGLKYYADAESRKINCDTGLIRLLQRAACVGWENIKLGTAPIP